MDETIQAEYAMSMNLGGSMVWSIDTDDFHGICDGTTFPMIKAIKEAMDGSIIVPTTPTMGPTTIHPTTVSTEETTVRISQRLLNYEKWLAEE